MKRTNLRKLYKVLIPFLILVLIGTACGGSSSAPKPVISEQYSYDDAGRLNYKVLPSGEKVSYGYDANGQLTEISGPGLKVQLAYDKRGNTILMENNNGKTEYQYDEFNRPIEVISKYSPEKKIRYKYDPWNRVTEVTVLNENDEVVHQVDYEYDMFGNLLVVNDGVGRIEYSYDPAKDETVRSLPNGVKSVFSYSPSGELLSLKHFDSAGKVMASYNYEYDAAGRIIQVQEETTQGTENTEYQWDNRGCLTEIRWPDGTLTSYQYDAMENRIVENSPEGEVEYKYDDLGKITQAGDATFGYDTNGNLNRINSLGRQLNLEYDIAGQLIDVKSSDGQTHCQYRYDGSGSLIWSNNNGKETTYLPDPFGASGFPLSEHTTDMERYYTYSDNLLSCRNGTGDATYFLEDGFNSIRLAIDEEGKVLGQRDYSPFGEVLRAQGEIPGNFLTAGDQYLPEAGFHLIGNRPYDPQIGRYLTPDPVLPQLASFATSNPYMNQTVQWAMSEALVDYSRYTFKEIYASRYGRPWGPLFEQRWGEIGAGYGEKFGMFITTVVDVASYWENLLAAEQQRMSQGVSAYSPDFWENWGRGGLTLTGSLVGGAFGPWGSLAGGLLGTFLGDVSAGLGQFYGARMDRPYWWWSPMKWLPQEEYQRRLDEQQKESLSRLEKIGKNDIEKKFPMFPSFPPCPPFCDDHGGGGGAATISLPYTPLPTAEDKLGGIDLGTTMRLTGDFDLGHVTGAVWDEGNKTLVLVGDKTTALPSIDASDLAVALKCIFDYGQEPAFSLDAADPANPSGPYQKAVYFGPIEGTSFGQAMFDADWKLKEYSFGVSRDENGQIHEIVSKVPGYKDIFDLSFEQASKEGESYTRFWITCADAPVYQKDGALYFGNFTMKVNTEKMYQAGKQGLVSSGGKQDPCAEEFAAHFTQHYDEFASEEPAFAKVKELAKAVALAKWLYEQNIPIDMSWVDQCLASSVVDTPKLVPTLTHEETREYTETEGSVIRTTTLIVTLTGGVDLSVEPRSITGGQELSDLASKVKEGLSSNSPVFDITQADKDLQAVVLPLTPTGKSIWGQREYVEQDGIKYYPANDKVTKAVDDYGSTAEFDWTPDGKLQGITWNLGEGYTATAKRVSEGDTLEMTTPEGNHILYSYDTSGRLDEVKVNGATYAKLSSSGDTLEVNYGEYVEKFVADNTGRVTSYEMGHVGSPESTRTLTLTYDELNNIAKLSGSDTGEVAFVYSGGKLSEVQLPGDKISYSYDTQDRLQSTSVGSGKAVEYSYEGDQVAKILMRSGERSAVGVFEAGRLVEYKDFFGATTRYEYTADGALSSLTDPLGLKATYEYNETGQLIKVNLPNGNIIQYKYDPKAQNRLIGIDIFPSESVFEQFIQSALPSLTIKVRSA